MLKQPPSIVFWRRGGKLNQKSHIDLTEEEKAHLARCKGLKNTHPCKNPIFRCPVCGNYGCTQEIAEKCSEQGFKNDKCLNCGTIGSPIPVMEHELANYVAEWDKEMEIAGDK
ncbi:MAG: hypothetical protein ACYCYM_00270 [Saccharofermentanales bacterium]